jgi:AP endonuclease-1
MPTSRARKRDPVEAENGVREASLKRKQEKEPDEKALPLRRTPNKSSRSKVITTDSSEDESPSSKPASKKVRAKVAETKVKSKATPKTIVKVEKALIEDQAEDEPNATEISSKGSKAKKRKRVTTVKEDVEAEHGSDCGSVKDEQSSPKKRKRKTQEEKEAEAMPLAARTTGLRMFVGAHTSIAKGLENSVKNCVHIGGNAFALFLKSQRKWENPPLKDESRDAFLQACAEEKYDAASHVLPHGSYLVNLAQKDEEKAKQAYDAFLDDLHRCEALGITYYNFHPGAAGKEPLEEAIGRVSAQLNRALAETKMVTPVLENMCGSGSIIGSRFSDLRDIIAGVKPEFRSRVGVCIDTCHAFAAGNDLRTPKTFKKVLEEFDTVVGIKYLKALHLNDSKAPFDSHRDLHQNIGLGFLGLRGFHNVMNEPRFQDMPLILETPCDRKDPEDSTGKKLIEDKSIWSREIKLLESLIGMDADGAEFKKLEKELSDQGKADRVKMQKAFDDKNEKASKKIAKEKEKGQKSLADMFGGGKKKKASTPVTSDEEEEVD